MKKTARIITAIIVLAFGGLLFLYPEACINGAKNGIILSSNVIIPSLFPFTFCVVFLQKLISPSSKHKNKLTRKIFGLNAPLFGIFIFSLIGGYPLGAKLINDSTADQSTKQWMLCYCVNAGPAFIISAVGCGIFKSKQIGIILFIAHVIPSFVAALLFRHKITPSMANKKHRPNITDNFILSVTDSAKTLFSVCSFVVIFSVICALLQKSTQLMPLMLIAEITNAVVATHNILIISAALGFGGFCVWCQVFSMCKSFKPNYKAFILSRLFHAGTSALIAALLIKVIKPQIPTFSNSKSFYLGAFADTRAVGVSLLIMGILLILSLSNKNYTGNIKEDVV